MKSLNWSSYYLRNILLDGAAGSENATGDSQKKLDVLSNEMMINALYNSSVCAVLVSEENDDPIIVEEALAGMKDMLMNYENHNIVH